MLNFNDLRWERSGRALRRAAPAIVTSLQSIPVTFSEVGVDFLRACLKEHQTQIATIKYKEGEEYEGDYDSEDVTVQNRDDGSLAVTINLHNFRRKE